MINRPSNSTNPAVLRILDANFDRAREGIRIIEEWCRFGLNHGDFAAECKSIRQELGRWQSPEIRAFRDTPGDPGTELSHPQEEARASVTQVLTANFCRTQEALRVLEEYAKIEQAEMAIACKHLRYRVYTLETNLSGHQRFQKLQKAQLYLVTSSTENLFATVESALQGGLPLVQYREKAADDLTRLHRAKKLCELCHQYDALFIVNDRVDIAVAADADGVHLGQEDLPVAIARNILGAHRIVGRSTTNPEEMGRALAEGADYIGVGPVYETPTKADKAAAGLDYVRYAADQSSIPWFAIGGIGTETVHDVLNAGAQRISVVRAIMQAPDPTLATQFFQAQLTRSHPHP